MKKVLVISTYFTTDASIGSVRVRSIVKYLKSYGWEPIILSPKIPGEPALPRDTVTILEYPDYYGALRRRFSKRSTPKPAGGKSHAKVSFRAILFQFAQFLLKITNVFLVPDYSIFWLLPAVRAFVRFQRTSGMKIDAIFSSSNPKTPHLIAWRIKKKTRVPWVAEYRDLWSTDSYYSHGAIRRAIDRCIEKASLRCTDRMVFMSRPSAVQMEPLQLSVPREVIPLGFDPDDVTASNQKLAEKFTLSYTGNLIPGKRDPSSLFEAVRSLIQEKKIPKEDIEIRFYGKPDTWLEEKINNFQLEGVARQYGYVDRATALRAQRESHVLLIFLWNDPLEAGTVTGKLEYLAARRPIVVCNGPAENVWQEMLRETRVGTYARTADEIATFLLHAYHHYKKGGGAWYEGDAEAVGRYSYRSIAGQIARLFDSLILSR